MAQHNYTAVLLRDHVTYVPMYATANNAKKVIHMQGSPSRCVRREIQGVAQVGEKGHEFNTVVTDNMFKDGINLSCGINSD